MRGLLKTQWVMPKLKRPTIVTVAQAAGVTDGTVSRALRGDPRVQAKTREKVMEAAQKLGYRPDLSARALKQGRKSVLGVFLDSGPWMLSNDYFGALLEGLAAAAEADQFKLLIYLPKVSRKDFNPLHDEVHLGGLADLADGRVDAGIIVGGRVPDAQDLKMLRQSGVPAVWLSPNEPMEGFSQLLSGARERSERAGMILRRLGHAKVGYLGQYEESTHHRASMDGLQQGLGSKAMLSMRSMEHFDFTEPGRLARQFDALLKDGISALVCSNVDQAAVVMDLALGRGLRIPEDLSLLSFGPRPASLRGRQPQLSLIHADLKAGGAQAFSLAKQGMQGLATRTETLEWSLEAEGNTLASI